VKQFDLITEADARVLAPGDAVMLRRGGHVTPLAADTLRDRRITVVREDVAAAEEAALAPVSDMRSLAVASDHTGVALRRKTIAFLRGRGLAVDDLGTHGTDPIDYPDIAILVADAVARREADGGIVIDASGIGSAIVANKVPGVRAVAAASETIARYAREQAGANVLALGALVTPDEDITRIVTTWLTTPMREPRAIRRLVKIEALERRIPRR
jgi:ribose 5-phosphate isomerase B